MSRSRSRWRCGRRISIGCARPARRRCAISQRVSGRGFAEAAFFAASAAIGAALQQIVARRRSSRRRRGAAASRRARWREPPPAYDPRAGAAGPQRRRGAGAAHETLRQHADRRVSADPAARASNLLTAGPGAARGSGLCGGGRRLARRAGAVAADRGRQGVVRPRFRGLGAAQGSGAGGDRTSGAA